MLFYKKKMNLKPKNTVTTNVFNLSKFTSNLTFFTLPIIETSFNEIYKNKSSKTDMKYLFFELQNLVNGR